MRIKYTFLLLLFLFSIKDSYSQISITFPMEKAVFQRNQNNQATLSIAGNYPANIIISYVQVRLINPTNNATVIDWVTLQNSPTGGIFRGTIANVPGGWYQVEVRAYQNTTIVGTATLSRVGVGEVFILAGQSNAQGLTENQGEPGATDERVVTHNELSWYDENAGTCDNKFPSYPTFSQISNNPRTNLSKTGLGPWCYGKLGDNLVSKLGVPVAFFNAGAMSTSSINWKESSDGLPTVNHYDGSQSTFCNKLGVPYSGLKRVLNYYASLFGVRAVLWHQGETDNFANVDANTYLNNIAYIINKSRTNFGSNVPWVISKATLFNYNDIQQDIRLAQQNLGSDNVNKLFSGPDTDVLNASYRRQDGVHFNGGGIIELANLWNASLDNSFFSNATPIPAKVLPSVSVVQQNTEFLLSAPAGYTFYKWVRIDAGNTDFEDIAEATTQSISRAQGTYRCYLTDNTGNITFTQPVTCGCIGASSCTSLTYLSNIIPCTTINGIDNPIRFDKSNDGGVLKMKGVTYLKGIGSHANSEIIYRLNGNYSRFISDIGLDDEIGVAPPTNGSVYFRVYGDNELKYESPLLTNASPTIRINIDISTIHELKLVTNYGPDNNFFDHTDWGNARVHCTDNQLPSKPLNLVASQIGQNCATINWSASTDNMEVEKYFIYVNNIKVDSVNAPLTTYRIKGLEALYYYTVKVSAKDYSGNESVVSDIVEFVTLQNLILGASQNLINIGQSSTLEAYGCGTGTILWSNGLTGTTIVVSPTTTTAYSATCKIGDCTSIAIGKTINVIPNCSNSYSLITPENNFSGSSVNLTYRASNTITANNLIQSEAKITYNAGKSVTLLPGFQAQSGTVFKAAAIGCSN